MKAEQSSGKRNSVLESSETDFRGFWEQRKGLDSPRPEETRVEDPGRS